MVVLWLVLCDCCCLTGLVVVVVVLVRKMVARAEFVSDVVMVV